MFENKWYKLVYEFIICSVEWLLSATMQAAGKRMSEEIGTQIIAVV